MTRADDTSKMRDRLLGWLLPDGGPADSLAQEDVERFCWYELPVKWMAELAEYPHILTALAELLQDAGRSRAAAVCTSEATREILDAWRRSPDQGRAAYQRAVGASPVTPPDTALLTWGPVMGIDEAVAHGNASRLLEQALDEGVLVPGARGYAAARIKHVERWLTTPHPAHDGRTPLDAVHSERRRTWAEAPPAARRRLRGALADLLSAAPQVPADTAEPLRWLLESVGDGVTLTQAGYLPRALVIEATERYDWYLPGMVPRTEYDVVRLVELHELAREARLLAKRHRKLSLTARGRQHLADPALLQAIAARAWFGDGVRAELAEAAAAALLDGELTLDDLTGAVHTLAAEAFTLADGTPPRPDDTRHFLWQWLRPGEALGFLAYRDRRRSTLSLTPTGQAAALTALRARARAPRTAPWA
ncbi:hypothetical protein [Actinacidiphila soli]|uniref:hypothetical protein n=1 Tax=Actinacidiphila soli TaxID=2487275 RepID=UPI0013E30FB8|nr:hypothetical protein [Actinacidiphila soli]